MIYKKGQIIPRRLVRCGNRKAQHLWKFGADVEVTGRTIKLLAPGSAITNNRQFIGGKKGRPRIYSRALIVNLYLICPFNDSIGMSISA